MQIFKVGDIVSWNGATGEVTTEACDNMITVRFSTAPGAYVDMTFIDDGTYLHLQTESCLKLIRRKKKKVTKTYYCGVRVIGCPSKITMFHDNKQDVIEDIRFNPLNDVVATVTYEVEE